LERNKEKIEVGIYRYVLSSEINLDIDIWVGMNGFS
jgi:hypothetical protein